MIWGLFSRITYYPIQILSIYDVNTLLQEKFIAIMEQLPMLHPPTLISFVENIVDKPLAATLPACRDLSETFSLKCGILGSNLGYVQSVPLISLIVQVIDRQTVTFAFYKYGSPKRLSFALYILWRKCFLSILDINCYNKEKTGCYCLSYRNKPSLSF